MRCAGRAKATPPRPWKSFPPCTPEDQFYLLMGEDMFLTLDRWYRPETIFSLASVCTTPRSADGLGALREKALEYTGQFKARCFLEHIPYLPVSSTQVRQAVARGEDVSGLVPQAVAAYIGEHGLYRG